MKKYDSMIIGHVTTDRNTDHLGNTVCAPGGAVLFSSAAAYALGRNVCVLTKAPAADRARLSAFRIPPEDVICLNAERNTDMVNVYFTPDKERRRCVCVSQGDPFTAADVPETVSAEIYHLAGLVAGDFGDDLIPALAKRGRVAVDVQGYLRHRDEKSGGEMFFRDWEKKKELLPFIAFLKTDAAEAEILTGETDRAAAAKLLFSWGAKEILITHNTEVLVYTGAEILTCPIKARSLRGRTGRGDTTFAAYLAERLYRPPAQALRTATAAVSLKMETPGPLEASRAQIEAYENAFFA